jgi:DNA polymerase-3 subunit alpha
VGFVHLHRHSEFSRLDGVGTAKEYAAEAARLGQGALALTDHGTLSGALHHVAACKGKDSKGNRIHEAIMPITGVEAYFRPNRLIAKQFKQRKAWHLCLFAKNLKGWHNLLQIVSTAFQDPSDGGGFYQYPCVDFELLRWYREGLMCSSACVSSYLAELIQGGDDASVRDFIDQMLSIFGDDFWIELQPHDFQDQRLLNLHLVNIAQERSIGLLATNDAHFPKKEWAETQRVAKLCGVNSSFQKIQKLKEKGGSSEYLGELYPSLYLASEGEMREWFRRHHPMLDKGLAEESIQNTTLFAQKITPFMLDKTDKLPKAVDDKGQDVLYDPEKILRAWIEEGWQKIQSEYPDSHWERWPKQVYLDRIESEWKILKSKGVIDYFVLVGDIVRSAKAMGIRVGLGRGSAAGCLISYLVGIVAIDPISWGLLFERFLNPQRKGLPDIDLDFQSDRRAEVKAYTQKKKWCDRCDHEHERLEHVADIITHSRFQPKSVIQAMGRVFDLPWIEMKTLTDTIEIRQDSEETTLEELLPINDKLQAFKAKYPEIWEHALRLEGSVQNAGKHAAGIIITPLPVSHYMALERGKKGDLVTSWSDSADFQAVSDHGFVKIDCLGIKGLTKHDYACKLIEKRHGVKVDLNKLGPLRNPHDVEDNVMEGFRRGYTIGVFQFGGRGITGLLKEIQPDRAFDLAAANALYRPGPMKGGVTWDYAKRKHDADLIDYWHPLVEPILEETYGLVSYQEQVMEISKQVGGFSGAEADDLRKAMGKLYRIKGGTAAKDFMSKYEEKWFAGCVERGVKKNLADEIWHKILEFGHYGFNKSHSASYALQAYQDMWLKMNYALEFYAAFLTYEDDAEKAMIAIREARSRGIKILPPDINTSGIGWTVDGDSLRFGLMAINGVGEKGAAAVITERAYGPFQNLSDFMSRIPSRAINSKAREALIESGAFDCWGSRSEADDKQIAAWEKHRLGMSLTVAGGAEKYAKYLNANIYTQDECNSFAPGTSVVIGGEISNIEKKTTKKGDPFANVTLIFELNEWRVKFWKQALEEFEPDLVPGNTIMVAGKTDEWNGFVSVVARDVTADLESIAEEA